MVENIYKFLPTERTKLLHRRSLESPFSDILLVIVFNFAHYTHIPILNTLYQNIFPKIVFCGPEKNDEYNITQTDLHKGYFSYMCMSNAMREHSNFTGYLLINDDILLNFWNFKGLDKSKVWVGPTIPITIDNFTAPNKWYWWKSRWGKRQCQKAFDEVHYLVNRNEPYLITPYIDRLISNGNGVLYCFGGRSDVFYIPSKYADDFMLISSIFYKHKVFLEIAVPTIIRMISEAHQREKLRGIYLPGRVGMQPVKDVRYLWRVYDLRLHFLHPLKLNYLNESVLNYAVIQYLIKPIFNLYLAENESNR